MAIINGGPGDDDLVDLPGENDTIDGMGGNDTITVSGGFDNAFGGSEIDRLFVAYGSVAGNLGTGVTSGSLATGYSGSFSTAGGPAVAFTGIEHFTVSTGSGNDTITTGDGDDTLNGGTGSDAMTGGGGNDTYVVDDPLDTVTEGPGGGIDVVMSNLTFYTLGPNVEDLVLTGFANIDGRGNELDNTLTGNFMGANDLFGLGGNDNYYVKDFTDIAVEAPDAGIDFVFSNVQYILGANIEHLVLTRPTARFGTGNTLDNVITGNTLDDILDGGDGNDRLKGGLGDDELTGGAGHDSLRGGAGVDEMIGGVGNDIYEVDETGDVVTELAGQGTDLVNSTATFTLSAHVENLTLTGGAPIDGTGNDLANVIRGNDAVNVLTGNAGDDVLHGGGGVDTLNGGANNDVLNGGGQGDTLNGGADQDVLNGQAGGDTLFGDAGNDVLDGGADIDAMTGGTGDDTYFVNHTSDTVSEAMGGGTDIVRASVTYTLSANVETLVLIGASPIGGTGNGDNNLIVGNNAPNTLAGSGGNDILNGGLAIDDMSGGFGDDLYYVTDFGDSVVENTAAGNDTVYATVPHTLTANVERLVLTSATALIGNGNGLANVITGNVMNDTLTGGAGNDILKGGLGNDSLNGDADADISRGEEGNDTIVFDAMDLVADGGANEDTLRLEGAGRILNLTLIPNERLQNLEVIDITGTGNNDLVLTVGEVLAISPTTMTLRVVGNAGDEVTADGGWTKAAGPPTNISGNDYFVYTNGAATLLVDTDITSNLPM